MRVTALGSGDAFCSAGRGHTCWLVDDARGAFAVDFGATALAALKRLGRDPDQIDAVHFTHLHGDHIGGWPFLLVDAVYRSQRRKPLLVTGPKGTGERLQALWAACYAAAAERPLPFAVEMHEVMPGDRLEVAGRSLLAFRAAHMSPPQIALSTPARSRTASAPERGSSARSAPTSARAATSTSAGRRSARSCRGSRW